MLVDLSSGDVLKKSRLESSRMNKRNVFLKGLGSVLFAWTFVSYNSFADEFVQPKNTQTESTSDIWVTPKTATTQTPPDEATEEKKEESKPAAIKAERHEERESAVQAEAPAPITTPAVKITPPAPKDEEALVRKLTNEPKAKIATGSLRGEILSVNAKKKFVVVDFKRNSIPPVGSRFGVYRDGNFVGSISLTNPIKPPYASADIMTGEIQYGDIIR